MTLQIEISAKKIGELLNAQSLKLVTVESCTGGGLSYWITAIPGSSAWFERGFVTYTNEAKTELTTVPNHIIQQFGAVSAETAKAMAEGGLRNSHADISIAITGIAGPSGGTPDKPVGTVWIAFAGHNLQTNANVYIFPGTRNQIRDRAILCALEKLADILQKKS